MIHPEVLRPFFWRQNPAVFYDTMKKDFTTLEGHHGEAKTAERLVRWLVIVCQDEPDDAAL